jgi:predicted ABC-type exoprotein transport system permease subunit
MDLDSAVDMCKKPNPETVALGKCTLILFFIFCPVILSFGTLTYNDYQMIVCIVLIVVIFLGLINHNME